MNIQSASVSIDTLLLRVSGSLSEASRFVYGFKPGEYDIVPVKKKRSINANDYCWTLCTAIADAISSTKEDIYRDAIKDVGIYKDFHNIAPDDARTLITAWKRQGIGWIAEQLDYEPDGDHVIIRAYYGSSVYNTKQMSRLIDWLVTEAKELGLETRPQEEVNALLEGWNEKRVWNKP